MQEVALAHTMQAKMRHRAPEKAAVAETMKRRITAREASESFEPRVSSRGIGE